MTDLEQLLNRAIALADDIMLTKTGGKYPRPAHNALRAELNSAAVCVDGAIRALRSAIAAAPVSPPPKASEPTP